MQHPTCSNIRIRSVSDVHKIFFAVQQGLLQMVTRRLDADERMQLRTGCVYAWEEHGPHTELTGLGIERFTEGRRWSPSRVRDEFLFYYEKYSPSPDCANPHPPRDWDPLVKQTYSVWVETDRGRRKWHLTAYFTQATVDQLGSIDDMRVVRDLVVPDDIFRSTRVSKRRSKNDAGESSKSSNLMASRFAPFPAPTHSSQPETPGQILMFQPYANHGASTSQQHQAEAPAQQFPAPHTSNPNPVNTPNFREPNQYHTQTYRPLLPSPHPRSAVDHLHRDLREYNSTSQQVPVRFNTDAQHPTMSLPQARPERERIPSSHSIPPPPTHLAANVPLTTSHSNVNTMQSFTPSTQPFPAASTSGWAPVNPGTLEPQNSSIYYRDGAANLAPSVAQNSTSYPPLHNEINPGVGPESYQIMAPYLNPVDLSGDNAVSREPLPSLSILYETYAFSYDISVSMVAPAGVSSNPDSFDDAPTHKSSSTSSDPPQKTPGSVNKPNGASRDLDLAPLNTLSRRQPYRREPMDDRALRLLWPRSP